MGRPFVRAFALSLSLAGLLGSAAGCSRGDEPSSSQHQRSVAEDPTVRQRAPRPTWEKTPGDPIDAGHNLGAPITVGAATVFPVYADMPQDTDDMITLAEALTRKAVTVRELDPRDSTLTDSTVKIGASNGAAPAAGPEAPPPVVSGPAVNSVAIENKGDTPILILAGTLIAGGNQDRQIGEDALLPAHATMRVSVYCVERGRWTSTREGADTAGLFHVGAILTPGDIRWAGQYEHNQGNVWAAVTVTNSAHQKSSPSDTLNASAEASDIVAKRVALAKSLGEQVAKAPQADQLVGLAYSTSGLNVSVRWFANHKLEAKFNEQLLQTVAFDALSRGGSGAPDPKVAAEKIKSALEQAPTEQRETDFAKRTMRKGVAGGASQLVYQGPSGAVQVTTDVNIR